jgi:hypothetical protein
VHLLDQAADVMADDLAKNFVDHRHVAFGPDMIPELRFIIENVDSTLLRLW